MKTADMWKIYFLDDGRCVKIGVTQNLEFRIHQLQTGNSNELKIFKVLYVEDKKTALLFERIFHDYFKNYKKSGEWFNLFGNTGYFKQLLQEAADSATLIPNFEEVENDI